MKYYFTTTIKGNFNGVIESVTQLLKNEGFGVLTEINIQQTLKNKLNVYFKKYTILGACNPAFAYEALQTEDKIGIFLPCSVVVKQNDDETIEVVVINPNVLGEVLNNPKLVPMMDELEQKIKEAIVENK